MCLENTSYKYLLKVQSQHEKDMALCHYSFYGETPINLNTQETKALEIVNFSLVSLVTLSLVELVSLVQWLVICITAWLGFGIEKGNVLCR